MFEDLINKNRKIAVVGLGYVGLPLSKLLSEKFDVIGFDIDGDKIEDYRKGIDLTGNSPDDSLKDYEIDFTSDEKRIREADFIIVTVPTPVKENHKPDLRYVSSASELIARNLRKGSIVVYESTVYPGVTEEICVPIIEEITGYSCGKDFFVGYSPERVNPGKDNKEIQDINKIVSGMDERTLDTIYKVYDSVIKADVYKAQSIKVAEAAKITENIQRDVNIALINELSIVFSNLGINTQDVLDAAATKWNFVKYTPGLVGGHCIGIDPYYLIHKSQTMGYTPRLIRESRQVNEKMVDYIVDKILLLLIKNDVTISGSRILFCGVTFKENCNDLRNSKVIDIIKRLEDYGCEITIYDPNVDADQLKKSYGLDLSEDYKGEYDAIVISVAHSQFKSFTYEELMELSKDSLICIDLKELLKDELKGHDDVSYWSL